MVSFVQEGLSFIYNFSGVDRRMVDRVLMRVAAQNSFARGPFSEYAYLGEPDVKLIVHYSKVPIDVGLLHMI